MSIDYCLDCENVVEGETTIHYLTSDPNAYEDGEYIIVCNLCGGDNIQGLNEDGPER